MTNQEKSLKRWQDKIDLANMNGAVRCTRSPERVLTLLLNQHPQKVSARRLRSLRRIAYLKAILSP